MILVTKTSVCACVCVFFPFILDIHQGRWTYQPGSHRRKVCSTHRTTQLRLTRVNSFAHNSAVSYATITQWCIFQGVELYKITQWCVFQGGESYKITQWCIFQAGELYEVQDNSVVHFPGG